MPSKGVIAAGHAETVRAAAAILEEGGNAFDAVLAAIFAACVAEPVLSSLGGGGFLLALPADRGKNSPIVYDFFTQTPKRKIPAAESDFYPIIADFGTVTQQFHIGMGAIATPGTVMGLFQVHRDLGTMPMSRLVEPAIGLARDGLAVTELQAYLFQIVGPIYMAGDASREIFESQIVPGDLRRAGETMRNRAFADTLDALAREGVDLFYKGDIAARIAADCRNDGGSLVAEDLAGYRVVKRRPLAVGYGRTRIFTNPPPSSGGILIAFALELVKGLDLGDDEFGTLAHLGRMARVMDLTNKARVESRLHEAHESDAAAALLDPALLARYRVEVLGRPHVQRGTTHVSVIDAAGNAAALTLSNGEGCGYIVPGTGIMLNNMLGEEDINPSGYHNWPTDQRLSSMMAPSLALGVEGGMTALGSGGSNRLRTAILQVLVNMLDFHMSAAAAVEAPRLHVEGGLLSIEPGFDPAVVDRLASDFREISQWDRPNLFFGGVHVAHFDAATASFSAGGDPRRGGAARVA
jgi:gamma-glutamyltranspeptidase / glutathione hydrolase